MKKTYEIPSVITMHFISGAVMQSVSGQGNNLPFGESIKGGGD